ncbi:MAG: helix-turn-helix domain-containing protein [Bacteroidales bacterium]|nr:helix-turn-helix domain-containing protein [Bacteroidales bacterium]
MELITFESDAFKKIIEQINVLSVKIDTSIRKQPLSDIWLDIQETCQLLKVSKRTLQAYRDNNILSFSQIGGKIYFKASDIDEHLKKHYHKCNNG